MIIEQGFTATHSFVRLYMLILDGPIPAGSSVTAALPLFLTLQVSCSVSLVEPQSLYLQRVDFDAWDVLACSRF